MKTLDQLLESREPYGKVAKLGQKPSAIFEILVLAKELKTPK
jgi:hypothetical protein